MGLLGTNYRFELFGRLKKKDSSTAGSTIPGMGIGPSMGTGLDTLSGIPSGAPQPQALAQQGTGTSEMDVLVNKVKELSSQGMPESQIIYTLKKEGYSFSQIDEAINKAIKTAATGSAQEEASTPPESPGTGGETGGFEIPHWSEPSLTGTRALDLEVSAIVESVVEERISSFKKALEDVDATLMEVRDQISNLDLSLKSVEEGLEKKINATGERVGKLEEKLEALEPRINALEKAFRDVIPSLVDSVREVHSMIQGLEEKRTSKGRGLKDLEL